jgi:hypothetical protein
VLYEIVDRDLLLVIPSLPGHPSEGGALRAAPQACAVQPKRVGYRPQTRMQGSEPTPRYCPRVFAGAILSVILKIKLICDILPVR